MEDNKDKGVTTTVVEKPKTTVNIEEKYNKTGSKVISKEVWIRHRPNTMGLPFRNADNETLNKIGSSYAAGGQDVLRGLNHEEEIKYLSSIIGINPKSEHWDKATKEYWANISKAIPAPEKDGTGGLKLEVGRIYFSQEDEDYDSKTTDESLKRGKPINVSDFILWRYCLVYNRVANSIEHINKSPKIDFYLFSKQEEIATKRSAFALQKEANQLFYSKMGERDWIDWVLRLFIVSDKKPNLFIKDLDKVSNDEKDMELKAYVDKYPERFITIGKDKSLEIKAFIELAIVKNCLNRIPNTDTIQMGDVTIGNTISEAVGYLTNPKNAKSLEVLRAQVNVNP